MNVQDIYQATQDTRKALIAMGYTSADCRISFNMAGPILISVEATSHLTKMVFVTAPTTQALQEGLDEVETWIHEIPNAKERAKEEFLQMVNDLPKQARELGVRLPVELAS